MMENNYLRILPLVLLLLLSQYSIESQAQESAAITVSGVVVDDDQHPLEGVTVQVKGSQVVEVTDAEGRFLLQAQSNDVIVFSSGRYAPLEIRASAITDTFIVMRQAQVGAGTSDDVSLPFGPRKKRYVTAAVSTVEGAQVPFLPLSSLENSLAGLLPGLYVAPASAGPGADNVSMLIRGRSSYNDGQSPLILVDGIERDLSDMDLTEIERITVLKDAASLAWYGVRGANGVILATTRHGDEMTTRVTLDATAGVQAPKYYTRSLDSYTYASLYNEALANDGLPALYSAADLDGYQNSTDRFRYPNNNFADEFLLASAPVQRYVATVSGGNAKAKYFTSLSYYNQGGLFAQSRTPDYDSNNDYKRYNFRSNVDIAVTSNLDVSLNIGGRVENRIAPGPDPYFGVATLLSTIFLTPPNAYPLINEDGSYGGSSLFQANPLAMLQYNGFNSQLTRVLLASTRATYKLDGITPGLSMNALYAYDFVGNYTSGQNQAYEAYEQDAVTGEYTRFGNKTNLSFRNAAFSDPYRNSELWAGFDYGRDFGAHGVNASIRYNNASTFNPNFSKFDYRRHGISSSASWNFQQRYMADVVFAYANNPRFSPGKRDGFFPAVSLGWIVSEADFLKASKTVDYLKLRGSYGVTGSEGLFNTRLYSWQTLYAAGFPGYNFGTSFAGTGSGVGEASLPNAELTFEKSRKFNVGFESRLLSRALGITLDYFTDQRIDIIAPAYVPGIIGQTLVAENNGQTLVKGFETSLDYTRQFNKLSMSLFGNFTLATSRLERYNEQPGLPENQSQIGHPLAHLGLMYEAIGIFKDQAEIDAAPRQMLAGTVRPGDLRYRDVNDDGRIDTYDQSTMDYTSLPKAYYGFGVALKYAGLDFSALFSGVEGRSVDIRNVIYAGNQAGGYINEFSVDRWTPATASTALWPRLAIADRGNNTAPSTYWIRSGDYLQLRNVELGYSLPSSLTDKLGIGAFRVFVSGYNLLTFSELTDLNINPLIVEAGRSGNYPGFATYTGGINVSF